jgi:hypothetical protein
MPVSENRSSQDAKSRAIAASMGRISHFFPEPLDFPNIGIVVPSLDGACAVAVDG